MSVTFQSVNSGKFSQLIIDQIKAAIYKGSLKSGDKLPSERELTESFKVSRVTLREALKTLETYGLLEIKRGSGVYVSQLDIRPMRESLSSMLRIQNRTVDDLTEARLIFEPSVAKLASERIKPSEIAKLEKNVQEMELTIETDFVAIKGNIDFHLLIAEATHNLTITLTMKTLLHVLHDMALEVTKTSNPKEIRDSSYRAISDHKQIVIAMRKKDSEKVYDLMEKHVHDIQRRLKNLQFRS